VITIAGGFIALIFMASYVGQSISSGMEGRKARILQWMCWFVATGTMLVCVLLTPGQPG